MTTNASPAPSAESAEQEAIARLFQSASVEMTIHDVPQLAACREWLRASAKIYVSYLPKQNWEQTQRTVVAVREAGFEPIPHVPVRQFESHAQLDAVLRGFAAEAGVRRLLLIAGDRATPLGPFASTVDVLETGLVTKHGIRKVIVAGHPEGHPILSADALRAGERSKIDAAQRAGLDVTFLTQFCFTAAPFVEWIRQLRARNIRAPVIAGLAGPTRITSLLKYAAICGVGASLRTLSTRGDVLGRLAAERGPETVIRALADAANAGTIDLAGIHLFSFGGLTRTCAWIDAAARGQIRLADGGFDVIQSDHPR